MQLVKVTHEQCRLDFFKKQLKTAERSMNYAVKHNYHHSICSEKGEIVSFYEWAVKMAEITHGQMEEIEPCQITVDRQCCSCGTAMGRKDNYCPNCGVRMNGGVHHA